MSVMSLLEGLLESLGVTGDIARTKVDDARSELSRPGQDWAC